MKISLDDLVSMAMFARVVEAKSFTAAASTLSVSKSVVSKRLAALEERLGLRLLHRTTRRLELTPEGADLYERCLHLLRAAEEAPDLLRSTNDDPRGVLRVSTPVIFSDLLLADAVADFVKRYPKVHVELCVNNAIVHLVGDQIDVAVRISSALESSSLIARRLATVNMVVCASPAYLRQRGTPLAPDELRAHACLRFTPLRPEVEWGFRNGRAEVIVPVSGPIASDNTEVLRRAALAGAGIIVMPHFYVADDLRAGRLVPLLARFPTRQLGLFAVYSKGKFVPAKARKFVDHLATRLRSVGWSSAVRA